MRASFSVSEVSVLACSILKRASKIVALIILCVSVRFLWGEGCDSAWPKAACSGLADTALPEQGHGHLQPEHSFSRGLLRGARRWTERLLWWVGFFCSPENRISMTSLSALLPPQLNKGVASFPEWLCRWRRTAVPKPALTTECTVVKLISENEDFQIHQRCQGKARNIRRFLCLIYYIY